MNSCAPLPTGPTGPACPSSSRGSSERCWPSGCWPRMHAGGRRSSPTDARKEGPGDRSPGGSRGRIQAPLLVVDPADAQGLRPRRPALSAVRRADTARRHDPGSGC